MEPANLHYPLQEQFTGFLYPPAEYYKVSSPSHLNQPSSFLNMTSDAYFSHLSDECTPDSRGSVSQNLMGYYCTDATQQSANELLLSKIKDEMPDSSPSIGDESYSSLSSKLDKKQQFRYTDHDDLLSTDHHNHWLDSPPCGSGRYNSITEFKRILPSIHISNSDFGFSLVSSSLDLSLQSKDLLASPTEHDGGGASSSQSSQSSTLGHHFMQQGVLKDNSPSNSSNKDEVTRKKRPNNLSQSKNVADSKKQRPTQRPSCPPLKVRKEKLGDRIATLQRLVAPYGKTDTASVLTEAIGYIQFLHDQVQTLSVPYGLKSLHNKLTRTMKGGSSEEQRMGQAKRDLRSRGLCLVPLSSASYLHG